MLNRIVRCDENGWSLEADPRHAELRIEHLGVGELRSAASPGIDGIDKVDREDDVEVTGSDATRFREVAARCNYLAFDRPDIQFPTKEISRDVQAYNGEPSAVAEIGSILNGQTAVSLEVRDAGPMFRALCVHGLRLGRLPEIQKEHFLLRNHGRSALLENLVQDAGHHCQVVSGSRIVWSSSRHN